MSEEVIRTETTQVICPSPICGKVLDLEPEKFPLIQHEDGTWTSKLSIICNSCRLWFEVNASRVTVLGVRYPTSAEMKTIPWYQEQEELEAA